MDPEIDRIPIEVNSGELVQSENVEKIVKFLSLPDVQNIDDNLVKKSFLKYKGVRDRETEEAFEKISIPRVVLNKNNNEEPVVQQPVNVFRSIFTLCYRLTFFVGISTSCFYLYKLWYGKKQKLKKVEREKSELGNELHDIKNELQTLKQNQSDLLKEVNSLKAILVGRKYFEEKQSLSFSIPSWQLNHSSQLKNNEKSMKDEKLLFDDSNKSSSSHTSK